MKKLLTLLLFVATFSNYAQITFENTYPTGSPTKNYLRLVKLSSSGYKYVINDTSKITLYNLNHSIFKTIIFPPCPGWVLNTSALHVFYISEQLFNTNPSDIEYFLLYTDKSFIIHSIIYNDIGNLLFRKDSTQTALGASYYGNEDFISYTPSGVKMIIGRQFNGAASVYSLPGTLPCHDCTNGTITSIMTASGTSQDGKISNYPNPSAGQTTVEYNLPEGITTADLVFYNITGQEVKRFKVTNAFHDIIISTADLDAGTYYYQILTATGFNAGKKMVVIK